MLLIRKFFLTATTVLPVRRLSRISWRLLTAMCMCTGCVRPQVLLLLCSILFEILEFVIKAHSARTFRSLQKVLGNAKKAKEQA